MDKSPPEKSDLWEVAWLVVNGGAYIGGAIGTLIEPGGGTAIGAFIGSLLGGGGGAVAGQKVGTEVYERVEDQ